MERERAKEIVQKLMEDVLYVSEASCNYEYQWKKLRSKQLSLFNDALRDLDKEIEDEG